MGVFIAGSFAGGFGFSPTSRSHDDMDVLCDFAVSDRRRLSKLVPMLIRTTEVREYLEKKEWIRTEGVATIVLTNAPYSMKYRGTGFEIRSRSPGQLHLAAEWSGLSIQDTFDQWRVKHWARSA